MDTLLLVLLVLLSLQYALINCNPYRDFGTNKLTILNYVPSEYTPRSERYTARRYEYPFPFILKPVVCDTRSRGVAVIKNRTELRQYWNRYDARATMIQEFINTDFEVGVLYERNPLLPGSAVGQVRSIVQRTNLHRDHIGFKPDPWGEHAVDRPDLISPALSEVIDRISKRIPNFFAGRFDIRFQNAKDFRRGRGFWILEANGAMGYTLYPLRTHPLTNLRWFLVRVWYGILNIVNGNAVSPAVLGVVAANAVACGNLGKLLSIYS